MRLSWSYSIFCTCQYLTNLLRSQLSSEESGDLVLALMLYPEEYGAQHVKDCLDNVDQDPTDMVEVLTTHSVLRLKEIGDTYQGCEC